MWQKKTKIQFKDRVVLDTVKIETVKEVIKPIKEIIIVKDPCDTLGNLKQFDKSISRPGAKVSVKSVKGQLQVKVNIDSIVNEKVKQITKNMQVTKEIEKVEVVKFKTPFWLVCVLGFSVLLNLLQFRIRQ